MKKLKSLRSIKKAEGFTLIELLVVVLIIGVLAAIAAPQYMKVVEKSRAAEALLWAKTLAEAEERHFMNNGTYTTDFEALDIEMPDSKHYIINIDPTVYNIRITPSGKNYGKYYLRYFMQNTTLDGYPGRFLCLHPTNDDTFQSICTSLGGRDESSYKYVTNTTAYYLN